MSYYDARTEYLLDDIAAAQKERPASTASAIYEVATALVMIFDQLQAINDKLKRMNIDAP